MTGEVAIHNKNGKGLLQHGKTKNKSPTIIVAIHNKNGKGLLPEEELWEKVKKQASQSTIKMEKGYYAVIWAFNHKIKGRNPQ